LSKHVKTDFLVARLYIVESTGEDGGSEKMRLKNAKYCFLPQLQEN